MATVGVWSPRLAMSWSRRRALRRALMLPARIRAPTTVSRPPAAVAPMRPTADTRNVSVSGAGLPGHGPARNFAHAGCAAAGRHTETARWTLAAAPAHPPVYFAAAQIRCSEAGYRLVSDRGSPHHRSTLVSTRVMAQ